MNQAGNGHLGLLQQGAIYSGNARSLMSAQASHPELTATEAREGLALRLKTLGEHMTKNEQAGNALRDQFNELSRERRAVEAALQALTEHAGGPSEPK